MSARILILEPDRLLGQIYQTALEQHGHEVVWCHSAQAAIAATDSQIPDMVIAELQLPMHNGVEFLYEFRSYEDLRSVPVIILSQVPPLLSTFGASLWDHLSISAYHYKPATKLADLIRSVNRVLVSKS